MSKQRNPVDSLFSALLGAGGGNPNKSADLLAKLMVLQAMVEGAETNSPPPVEAKVGDVVFVKAGSDKRGHRPSLAAISNITDGVARCRVIGSQSNYQPTVPVDCIPDNNFESANITPVLKDVENWDVEKVKAAQLKKRQDRQAPVVSFASCREEDEKILYRVARNLVMKEIDDKPDQDDWAFSCRINLGRYATAWGNDIFNNVRDRINTEVLNPVGLSLTYFGPSPDAFGLVSFVIEDAPMP